jgi:ATP-dependent RNA helicase DDX55/SPB4
MWNKIGEQFKLDEEIPKILNNIYQFNKITKVQYIVINEFLKNEDVIVKSVTGSGKTLSYIIPLFQRLINYSKENLEYKNQTLALILLPARELSEQVLKDILNFINNMKYKFTFQLLIGGKKVENDIEKYNNEIPNIIIATPGRLIDIDEKVKINFQNLQIFILDEADKMLDMGFEVEISYILSKIPKQRRTGLFSATVTSNIENIIKAGMRNPIFIDIKIQNNKSNDIFINENDLKKPISSQGSYYKVIPFNKDNNKINNSIQELPQGLYQYYIEIKNIKYKIPHLIHILNMIYNGLEKRKIMIFLSTCNSVDYFNLLLPLLFKKLSMTDFSISKLHSKISQNKRNKEYKLFKIENKNKLNILLSTDLASRGIDIPNIDMIIQFDPPKTDDSYIHKAGRTARVDNKGISLLFLNENELTFLNYMKQKGIFIQKWEDQIIKKEEDVDLIFSENNKNGISVLNCIKEINISDKWIYDKAVNTFVSFLRYYQEIELKYIFHYPNLDIGNFANSLQLLKLPRLKKKDFDSVKNFIPDEFIQPKDLIYLNKNIEKQMNEKKKKIDEKMDFVYQKKREKKEEMKLKGKRNEEKNRSRREKKEAKIKNILDEWDDLADDDKLYKKYKKGKITKEEYEKELLKIK